MDSAGSEKLDTGLLAALEAFEENRAAGGGDDDGMSVVLRFEGDLAPVEALGFETMSVSGSQALGIIRFRDVPAIAAHPNVLSIEAGRSPRKLLDQAVPDGRVRASSKASVGTDGLWHIAKDGADFKAEPDATGAGVIVAILDTGIDITHPMFLKNLAPKETRILSIWDQGLKPAALTECPDGALLLDPAKRYGVEYKTPAINDALTNPGKPILHSDCDGHGTHVAGIAAGGVLFPKKGDASRVGVALQADIIAVKMLDGPDEIRYRTATGFGDVVGWNAQFRDAVLYCLRTARGMLPKRPIVINMSFGDAALPGDGLDANAEWLDTLLDPTKPEDKDHFPAGCIVTKAAGNEGTITDRMTAKITVPAGGQVIVPIELIDRRHGENNTWKQCGLNPHNPSIDVNFWYRPTADLVKFALRLPHQALFNGGGADIGAGQTFDRGFTISGSPLSAKLAAPAKTRHRAVLKNYKNAAVTHPGPPPASVTRHNVAFSLYPKESSGAFLYQAGIYEIRIKAPAGTEIFVMCDEEWWGDLRVHTTIPATMQNGDPISGDIVITARSSATDTLGKHVITVAAYDSNRGTGGDPALHPIAPFSSRGPLRDFSNPAKGPIADKPDVAGPGVDIDSAQSTDVDSRKKKFTVEALLGVRFEELSGTSMSAPFIAGVIALMLDKKPDLKTADVRTALNAGAALRPGGAPAAADADYAGAYGSGMVDGLKSHKSI